MNYTTYASCSLTYLGCDLRAENTCELGWEREAAVEKFETETDYFGFQMQSLYLAEDREQKTRKVKY